MKVIQQVVETQTPCTTEYQLNLQGEQRWFNAHVVPFDSSPLDPSVLWVSRDITDLVLARQKMQADQELLRSLLELEMQAREVVAYEIHDGFVQHAVGTQMWLQALHNLVDLEDEKIAHAMDVAMDSIAQGVADARAMIATFALSFFAAKDYSMVSANWSESCRRKRKNRSAFCATNLPRLYFHCWRDRSFAWSRNR